MTKCLECGELVEFSEKKQEYFSAKDFPHPPMFCNKCQNEKLSKVWNFSGLHRTATCSICKVATTLTFIPTHNEPLLCKQCYDKEKAK